MSWDLFGNGEITKTFLDIHRHKEDCNKTEQKTPTVKRISKYRFTSFPNNLACGILFIIYELLET